MIFLTTHRLIGVGGGGGGGQLPSQEIFEIEKLVNF